MKFINRKKELNELEDYFKLSKNKLVPIMIYGQRQIGKTELIKRFIKNRDAFYFFVYNNKSRISLLKEFEEELKESGVIEKGLKLMDIKGFLDIIFSKMKNKIVVFDEFQNFNKISPEIFSMLQKKIDENKNFPLMLIFQGSIIGLMKKIFEDLKEPLYERIKVVQRLDQFRSGFFLKDKNMHFSALNIQ